jgi:hypothetical protein
MEVLNMIKEWGELLGELNVVGDLIFTRPQLTTRNGICLIMIRFDVFEKIEHVGRCCDGIRRMERLTC